jgi:tetratricopeptide (TPR) repeat protein
VIAARHIVVAGALVASAVARAAPAPRVPSEQGYFQALERERLVAPGAGTAEDLEAELRTAADLAAAGEHAEAAARLYLVVEGPRYAERASTAGFEDAEFQLGVALTRGGAINTGRAYLERLAARAGSPYAEPALRRLVDVALEHHDAALAVRRLDAAGVAPAAGPLAQELDYLRGRAAYDARSPDEAETALRRVGPHCRFFSSAIYLRGVIAVRRGDLRAAQDAFCVVADQREGDPLRFVIDGRYYTVRDLARLALGRVAHEQGRFDDAFYHYFNVPSDSRELPHALFESAWSMLQGHKYPLARRLVEELLEEYPDSPLAAEARLLRATLDVKTCRFAAASRELGEFLAAYEPVEALVAEAKRDAAARRAIGEWLLGDEPLAKDSVEARLRGLLELTPTFQRLAELERGLRAEAGTAATLESGWKALAARLAGEKVQPVAAAGASDATALLEQANALGASVTAARDVAAQLRRAGHPPSGEALAALGELEERRERLAKSLARLAGAGGVAATEPTTLAARVSQDRALVKSLRARAATLATRIEAARGALLGRALVELGERLGAMLRHARLGRIDATVGEKKRLEKQIQDLAAGRFPASMADRLHIEGLIGDDEEYWPPEVERWADEYEGYR